jgi:chorismate mutase / prephenate dehydratase
MLFQKSFSMRIAVSGAHGSFSEEAGKEYCRIHGIENPELVYLVTAENVLSAVQAGAVDRGIVPIENSTGGVVIEAIHALARHVVSIEKLFEIVVKQNLLVAPGTKREEIAEITSHDQALKQCRMYLKRAFPNAEVKEYPDTAQAAKDLGEGVLPKSTAIIAPLSCAKLYNLEVMEESIQDLKFNVTNFMVVVK